MSPYNPKGGWTKKVPEFCSSRYKHPMCDDPENVLTQWVANRLRHQCIACIKIKANSRSEVIAYRQRQFDQMYAPWRLQDGT